MDDLMGGQGARPPEPSAPGVATLREEWRRSPQGRRSAALLVLFFVGPLVLVAVGFRVVPDDVEAFEAATTVQPSEVSCCCVAPAAPVAP